LTRAKTQPHDAIDLTDNEIQMLGNFPLSPRLRTLLLARNGIVAMAPQLPRAMPNLRNLVLTSNKLGELADLDVLAQFPRLAHLVLMDNPVAKKEVSAWLWGSPGGLDRAWPPIFRAARRGRVGSVG
jgi:hypothetical protein